MTREEWDEQWKACFARLRAKGYDPIQAQKVALNITFARYGARPPGTPLWLKLALLFLRRKLSGLGPMKGSPMTQRIVVSLVYGIAAAAPVLTAAWSDGVLSGNEWGGILSAFIVAAYGKFSSSTTVIAPNRQGESFAAPPAK